MKNRSAHRGTNSTTRKPRTLRLRTDEEAGTIGLIARLPDIGNLSPADGDIADGTIAGGMIANTKYQICHDGAACRNFRNADYLGDG